MPKVHTIKGLIDRDRLTVKDIVTEDGSTRSIASEWYLGDELVKRSAWVDILEGQAIFGEQAEIA